MAASDAADKVVGVDVRLPDGILELRSSRVDLDEKLKALMQELGSAINESLADSDRIAAAIGEIKRAGYDVFLVLEATIGFNKREAGDEEDVGGETRVETEFEPAEDGAMESTARIKFTTQDQKFLRALKIAIDEDAR